MIICLIDYKDLTEEQKKRAICFYKVNDEYIEDFTIKIDEIHDKGDYS